VSCDTAVESATSKDLSDVRCLLRSLTTFADAGTSPRFVRGLIGLTRGLGWDGFGWIGLVWIGFGWVRLGQGRQKATPYPATQNGKCVAKILGEGGGGKN